MKHETRTARGSTINFMRVGDNMLVQFGGANFNQILANIKSLPNYSRYFISESNTEAGTYDKPFDKNYWKVLMYKLEDSERNTFLQFLETAGTYNYQENNDIDEISDVYPAVKVQSTLALSKPNTAKLWNVLDSHPAIVKPYQREACKWALARERSLLALEQGMGKTLTALTWAYSLLESGEVDKVLILTSKKLKNDTFKKEFKKWKLDTRNIIVGHYEQLRTMYKKAGEPNGWTVKEYGQKLAKTFGNKFALIIDESANYVNHTAIRSKVMLGVAEYANRVLLLTGTPFVNGLKSSITQLKALKHPVARNIKRFNDNYVHNLNNTTMDNFRENITDWMLALKQNDYIELPDSRRVMVNVSINQDQKAYLDRVFDRYIESLEVEGKNTRVIEENKRLVERTKMLQEVAHMKTSFTIEWVKDRVSQGKKAIVFSQFTQVIDKLKDNLLRYNPVVIDGRTKNTEEVVADFLDGDSQVLIGQLQVASKGLNLVNTDALIFNDTGYNPEDLRQAEKRIDRLGQDKECQFIYPVIQGTMDEQITRGMMAEKARIHDTALIGKSTEAFQENYTQTHNLSE
jgi:SNF2 family DNA or RNA helicase